MGSRNTGRYISPSRGRENAKNIARKKITKIGLSGLVAVAIICAFIWWSPPEEHQVATAIIVQQSANSKHVTGDENMLRDMVWGVNANGGVVYVIAVSGNSELLDTINVDPPNSKDRTTLNGRYDRIFAPIGGKIDSMVPSSAELDFVAAIELASKCLNSEQAKMCTERKMIVIGGGLSTSSEYVEFSENRFNTKQILLLDPDDTEHYKADLDELSSEIISRMQRNNALPNLRGINIAWFGMGDLVQSSEGQKIPSYVKSNLKAFWYALLLASDAEDVDFPSFTNAGSINSEEDYPHVTVVDFPPDELLQPTILPDSRVEFVGDTSKFVSQTVAIAVLNESAPIMRSSRQKFLALGTAASHPNKNFIKWLSEDRARVICENYVSLGVDPKNLYYLGGSNETSYFVPDLDANGYQTEAARSNRTVIILLYDSKEAQEFIRQFGPDNVHPIA